MIVLSNQSLLDIAVQESGSALAGFDWAIANNVSITDDLMPGQKLVSPISIFENEDILKYFKNKSQLIATAINIEQTQTQNIGIGSMAVGTNFIIAP
jgi:hypothetical protein